VAKTVRERAAELGMKAVGKLFEDPRRAEAIGKAIAGLQQAKAALDDAQEKALKAAGLPTRDDFKTAGKRISALKRQVKELTEALEEIGPKK
jgi:polyhydroxyalkanoate synthesis regulator phasin